MTTYINEDKYEAAAQFAATKSGEQGKHVQDRE